MERSMSVRSLAAPLALLATMLMAGSALAITPVGDLERSATRQEIARQLGKSYALVIGISDFDNAGWADLSGVPDEYRSIRGALEQQGFEIVPESRLGRVDHQSLTAAISRFFAAYGNDAENRLVVYIATHGYADPARPDGDGYLVPSDGGAPADGRITNGYSVRQLSAELTALPAQHVFLFFNSCFSGAMLPEPTRAANSVLARKPHLALSRETADWTRDLLSHNARLVLTAGNASQTVPDASNPFARAVVDALSGAADTDGDGLLLGTEIAQFVRGRVARETRLAGHANDPVFAVLPKLVAPAEPRPDASDRVDYALQGDFIFLNPRGPAAAAEAGLDPEATALAARRERLEPSQFVACADCPTMVEIPAAPQPYALASTEITFAQWDACYRESGCKRYLPDDGLGRGDRPAGGVTWHDALEYVTWLSGKSDPDEPCLDYRLPSTGEWRRAALYGRHGDVTWQAAVADASPVCWGCGPGQDGQGALRTAASPANPAGLYDMVGNLWEWVDEDAGACDLTALRQEGICAPGRVMGGSYATSAEALASIGEGGNAPRTTYDRGWSSPAIGFRVACDVVAGR